MYLYAIVIGLLIGVEVPTDVHIRLFAGIVGHTDYDNTTAHCFCFLCPVADINLLAVRGFEINGVIGIGRALCIEEGCPLSLGCDGFGFRKNGNGRNHRSKT